MLVRKEKKRKMEKGGSQRAKKKGREDEEGRKEGKKDKGRNKICAHEIEDG